MLFLRAQTRRAASTGRQRVRLALALGPHSKVELQQPRVGAPVGALVSSDAKGCEDAAHGRPAGWGSVRGKAGSPLLHNTAVRACAANTHCGHYW